MKSSDNLHREPKPAEMLRLCEIRFKDLDTAGTAEGSSDPLHRHPHCCRAGSDHGSPVNHDARPGTLQEATAEMVDLRHSKLGERGSRSMPDSSAG